MLGKTGLEYEMMLTNRRNGLKTIRYNSKGQVPRAGLGRKANLPKRVEGEQPEGRAAKQAGGRAEPSSAVGSTICMFEFSTDT